PVARGLRTNESVDIGDRHACSEQLLREPCAQRVDRATNDVASESVVGAQKFCAQALRILRLAALAQDESAMILVDHLDVELIAARRETNRAVKPFVVPPAFGALL